MSYRREVETCFGSTLPPGVRDEDVEGTEPSDDMSDEDLREIARAEGEWNDPRSDVHRRE